MKTRNITFSLLITIVLLLGCLSPALAQTPSGQATPADQRQAAAQAFVDLLAQGEFSQAAAGFDATMTEKLPVETLEKAWKQLVSAYGPYQQAISYRSSEESGYFPVVITTQFEKGLLDVRVVYNTNGQISGLFFLPSKSTGADYRSPDYVKPEAFSEVDVTLGSGEWALPGTLSLPKGEGPFPAVVLVHSSGPNDRDETLGPNKPLRDLAQGLASQGVAVLRYDKRSLVYPEKLVGMSELTVQEEVIDDALVAIELLRERPEIDAQRIYLAGHSLGGMLAPRIAQQAPQLAGLIILAGPTRPLEDLIVEQIDYIAGLDNTISAEEQAQIDEIKRQVVQLKGLTESEAAASEQVLGATAAYWLDLSGYDPAETAAGLELPMLVLRGERDYQVGAADFAGWEAALAGKAGVYLKQYPRLNHLLMAGSGPSTPAEYERAGNVSPSVVDDMADFIQKGQVNTRPGIIGDTMGAQEIMRLILLLIPIFLIQLGISIYALVDLARRKKVHGPRWLWLVLLVLTLFTLPTGLIVSGVYLLWGRKVDEDEDDYSN